MPQNPPKTTKNSKKYITERIEVDKFIPGGQAISTLTSGKKIFLWGALPGEVVTRTRVTKEKSKYLEGIAEEIAEPSKLRVAPRDACYLATSPWQILDFRHEMPAKAALVTEIFREHGIEVEVAYHEQVDQAYGYRNKMEYALYYDHSDAKIHLAFHERGSHRKIPVAQSSIERPEIWQAAQTIIDQLNQQHADARQYQSLLLRCSQNGRVSGGLYENGQPHPAFPALEDELFGIKYSYSPNGFFQINLPVYTQALTAIRAELDHVRASDNALDLYAGVGTIGLSVARHAQLTLVECDKSAYTEMIANVKTVSALTQNSQIQPVLAKSEAALDYVAPDQIVIVDPPRAGCMPEVIHRFLEVKPKLIIYLSCNPATQARDVKLLLPEYSIKSVETFNFFPRTPHIENLIVLERKHN